tara:strand:+ start:769 stop:1140 length:372 start_codon:yes stop_codon:yes gene_type:complete
MRTDRENDTLDVTILGVAIGTCDDDGDLVDDNLWAYWNFVPKACVDLQSAAELWINLNDNTITGIDEDGEAVWDKPIMPTLIEAWNGWDLAECDDCGEMKPDVMTMHNPTMGDISICSECGGT